MADDVPAAPNTRAAWKPADTLDAVTSAFGGEVAERWFVVYPARYPFQKAWQLTNLDGFGTATFSASGNVSKTNANAMDLSRQSSLGEIMKYRNDAVVNIFRESFPMARDEAEEIFDDMKRLVWLVAEHMARGERFRVNLLMRIVDEMWHTFVYFTDAYAQFCQQYFGRFIPHRPTTAGERAEILDTNEQLLVRPFRQATGALGLDVARRWFLTYPTRYNYRRQHQFSPNACVNPGAATIPLCMAHHAKSEGR